jgi:hypothetical protein
VASKQRAEYVKQKIQEQEDLQRREQEAQSDASAGLAQAAAKAVAVASDDPFVVSVPEETTDISVALPAPAHATNMTKEDLMASGSSPPGYSSPKVAVTTEEEQQTSSPLASPTRDVRGARKTDHSMAWMMGLGMEKQQHVQQPADQQVATADAAEPQETAVKIDKAVGDVEKSAMTDVIDLTSDEIAVDAPELQAVTSTVDMDELEEEQAVEQATSPQRRQEINVKDVPAYQTMKSVVNQLRSHPTNQWFRQPCEEELQRFCQERNRPVVDLFTISNAITLGEYGLDDPLKHFKADLDQMWNNIRTFYPSQSQQTHCATMLETFSGILLEEWKRSTIAATRVNKARPVKPRPLSTPISRVEKHPLKPGQDNTPRTQQQAYFASLVAKAGLATSRSPSGNNVSKTGQPLKRSSHPSRKAHQEGAAGSYTSGTRSDRHKRQLLCKKFHHQHQQSRRCSSTQTDDERTRQKVSRLKSLTLNTLYNSPSLVLNPINYQCHCTKYSFPQLL